jgi:putative hydrolase of the HAD superfamily
MKNIIFDVDDTLYDLMEPFAKAHEEMFASLTKDTECEELFKWSRTYSDEAFYLAAEGKIAKEDEFAYRIIKTYERAGIQVSGEDAKKFEERYRFYQKHLHLPKMTEKILDLCKEHKIPRGLLTNGTSKNQGKKLKVLALERWFDKENMFISEEVGAPKPDVRAFQAVQDSMHLQPKETWFIGDTFEVDVVGAKNAGWHVIWFNHRHRPMPEGEIHPDLEVRTYEELLEAILKIFDIV